MQDQVPAYALASLGLTWAYREAAEAWGVARRDEGLGEMLAAGKRA